MVYECKVVRRERERETINIDLKRSRITCNQCYMERVITDHATPDALLHDCCVFACLLHMHDDFAEAHEARSVAFATS